MSDIISPFVCLIKLDIHPNLLAQILTANPWPKTTTLVEPGHRSPMNSRLSKLLCRS
jgi:hypothetical protein